MRSCSIIVSIKSIIFLGKSPFPSYSKYAKEYIDALKGSVMSNLSYINFISDINHLTVNGKLAFSQEDR